MAATQTYSYSGLPVPPSADPAAFKDFGRKVEGFNPDTIDDKGMAEIVEMLYKVGPSASVWELAHWLAFGPTVPRGQVDTKATIRNDSCMSKQGF
jgi:hypothetical protein